MYFSDSELCMLVQLCYLDGDVAKAAEIKGFDGIQDIHINSVLEAILKPFTEDSLNVLNSMGNKELSDACADGREWSGIIRYLKASPTIKRLFLTAIMYNESGTKLALCFAKSLRDSTAIVAFKGTSGKDEWIDNAEGLNLSDTDDQKEALSFIEGLRYSDIISIGHSKGGNKAMYTAVTSEKVSRCVSFDGQGFSKEFIDKYRIEIGRKGRRIKNYSLATDYVHALMLTIPNSGQIYCRGYGVDNVKQHHSPNSFFKTDDNRNLALDENLRPIIVITKEDEAIKRLHEFTVFIMNNADSQEKALIVSYMGKLLSGVFSGNALDKSSLVALALSDTDTFALIIAYLAAYIDIYNIDAAGINILLGVIGLNFLDELITLKTFDFFDYHIAVNLNLADIINYIKKQLNDDDNDFFIKNLFLPLIKKWFFNDLDINVRDFWERINSKARNIKSGLNNF